MKKILITFLLIFTALSCISIEKINDKQIIDTTIIKDGDNKGSALSDLPNFEILKDTDKINQVLDRNKRKYNYNLKGLWVASVNNLDYPKRPGSSVDELKREYITLIDNVKKWGFNAIFYQIKPGADSLYKNTFWPTSRYLVLNEGDPFEFDLLKFMIEQAHKRGIEFHAWINPYRASQSSDPSLIANDSILRQHPEWVFVYANKIFLNPGNPEVVSYVSRSIEEVVRNYDIDGIHLDDYFYPYPVTGSVIRDYNEYQKYGKNFNTIEDWRRNNVNEMIKNLSVSIHKIKPSVVFGVSPFGIWRNQNVDVNGSNTNGLQSYDNLYADSRLWMEKGWVDYIAPQIYWAIGKKGSDYEILARWWNKEAIRTNTVLYTGNGVYKYSPKESDVWQNKFELKNQLNLNNKLQGVNGYILFRYETLVDYPFIIDQAK